MQSSVVITRSSIAWHYIYNTAVNDAEYESEFESTKYIPYLALMGELWDVFVRIWEKIGRAILGSIVSH